VRSERFSVCTFSADGSYEYVHPRFVPAVEAVRMARACIESIGAKVGIIERVIITDGGDATNFEWEYGRGVTFPPPSRSRD
jgi:hypothetical protein